MAMVGEVAGVKDLGDEGFRGWVVLEGGGERRGKSNERVKGEWVVLEMWDGKKREEGLGWWRGWGWEWAWLDVGRVLWNQDLTRFGSEMSASFGRTGHCLGAGNSCVWVLDGRITARGDSLALMICLLSKSGIRPALASEPHKKKQRQASFANQLLQKR